MKKTNSQFNKQNLSNQKINKIEKNYHQELFKASEAYLSVQLEKYKHLKIIST